MTNRSRTSSDISIENKDISNPIINKMKKMRRRKREQRCSPIPTNTPNPNDYEFKDGMIYLKKNKNPESICKC